MARFLRQLKVMDVSSVDVGAGRGVNVVLTKRHADSLYNKPLTFGRDIGAEADAYIKREFTQAERDSAAASGAAMEDGSFPIHNKSDLANAIRAVGRAKDPAKAKAHIKARAASLGATDQLPDSWSKRAPTATDVIALMRDLVAKGSVDFDEAHDMIETAEDASDLMNEIREACCALDCSVQSILCDDELTDKAAAIAQSFDQFKEHLAAIESGEPTEKNMTTVTPAVQKIIDDAVAAAVAKSVGEKDALIAKQARDIVIAKMSEKHKAHHDTLGEDAKGKFEAMSPAERDAEMEKTKKRAEDDPIYKRMASENEDLRKRLTAIEDEKALDIAKRDAKELGMTQTDAGEVLMKARRGDKDAMAKVEEHTRQLIKARNASDKTSKVFEEVGTNRGATGGDAMAELTAKADELRKSKPELTEAQAFDKVMNDPANRELAKRERDERMNKINRAA